MDGKILGVMSFYNGQKVIVVGFMSGDGVLHGTIQYNKNSFYPWYFTSDDGRIFLSFTPEGWEYKCEVGNYDAIHMIPHKHQTSLEKFYEL